MLRFRPALAGLALAGLCFALSARAALFDDDEARKRIEATNQRVTQVQKQLDAWAVYRRVDICAR